MLDLAWAAGRRPPSGNFRFQGLTTCVIEGTGGYPRLLGAPDLLHSKLHTVFVYLGFPPIITDHVMCERFSNTTR